MAQESFDSLENKELCDILPTHPRVLLSLKFQCDHNTTSKRHLCEEFWKLIEQDQNLDKIMAIGWSASPEVIEKKKKTEEVRHPCDILKQLVEKHTYIQVPRKKRNDEVKCLNCLPVEQKNSEESVIQLLEDLNEYDSRVVPVHSIPPKIERK